MQQIDAKAMAQAQTHFIAALGSLMQAFGAGEAGGPALLTASEAASYLGMGRTKFYELFVTTGQLQAQDLGAGPRYLRKDLDKIISLARRK